MDPSMLTGPFGYYPYNVLSALNVALLILVPGADAP
jgi:hypothetical protein